MKPKEVLKKWVEYMNSHEPAKLAALYHDDATNLQVAIGTPLVGRQAIHQDFQNFFTNISENSTKIVNLFEDGEWAILEWTGGGVFKPTGKKFTFTGCGFFHVVDGKIKLQRGYWDMAMWCKNVGLPLTL